MWLWIGKWLLYGLNLCIPGLGWVFVCWFVFLLGLDLVVGFRFLFVWFFIDLGCGLWFGWGLWMFRWFGVVYGCFGGLLLRVWILIVVGFDLLVFLRGWVL